MTGGAVDASDVTGHGHLKRLDIVWQKQPVYFITTCVAQRRALLANDPAHRILREEWIGLRERHGWATGRYVIMPDHVHFFVTPLLAGPKLLTAAIGKWKEWTSKRILKLRNLAGPLWQPEFFDHLLRSQESRTEKWAYVRENPVRAGLTADADLWPYAGTIDFE